MSRKITKEDVANAVEELREHGLLSDTSKNPDGTRGPEQWMNAIGEDTGIIRLQLKETVDEQIKDQIDIPKNIAVALKEVRRLESDIYRFAQEVHGIDRKTIDDVGPL